ncbi:MAG: hypothetical protein ACSHYF_16905 [Verrucomicrobiaceae bacterium]
MKNVILLGLGTLATLPTLAEIDPGIPFGIEGVAGIRTGYVYRGFELAKTSSELQFQAEIALSNESAINLGAWHLSESDGPFSETGTFIDLRHEITDKTLVGASLTYRNFRGSLLKSGLDLGLFAHHQFSDNWDAKTGIYFDTGNDSIYADANLRWSHPISDSTFISLENGVSYVSDYLNRDGFNDLHGRLSLTYALSDSVAFTPFLGWSIQLDDKTAGDAAYGGVWFEVIF